MTAFDIYSAIGGAGEDILEESETVPKRKLTKIIPLMATAACFVVVAVGLSHTLRSDGIEKPVTDINSMTTYPALDGSESPADDTYTAVVTEPPVTGSDPTATSIGTAITGDGIVIYDPEAQTTSVSLLGTETDETLTEQTTIYVPPITETISTGAIETEITSAQDEEEIVIIPKWEDMDDLERYMYLEYEGNEYSITMEKFDKSELTFLQNSKIYGIDEYTDKKYSMECAVYKIGNVTPDYMVAVLTADGLYTGFIKFPYYAETLADYLTNTDFLNRDKIGEKVSIDDDDKYCATVYTLNDLPKAVEKLLTAAPDTPPTDDLPWTPNCYFIYSATDKSFLRVYDNGYVYLCNRHFHIGKEHTDAFIDYVKKNAVNVEVVPYDTGSADDPVIPE